MKTDLAWLQTFNELLWQLVVHRDSAVICAEIIYKQVRLELKKTVVNTQQTYKAPSRQYLSMPADIVELGACILLDLENKCS